MKQSTYTRSNFIASRSGTAWTRRSSKRGLREIRKWVQNKTGIKLWSQDTYDNNVERKERNEDTQITPAIIKRDANGVVEVFSSRVSTILACGCRVGVVDIASDAVEVALCVLVTLLTTRRIECTELPIRYNGE